MVSVPLTQVTSSTLKYKEETGLKKPTQARSFPTSFELPDATSSLTSVSLTLTDSHVAKAANASS